VTPEPGAIIASKYRLVRPLAAGGMGSVWVAEHLGLQVEVAMKFMLGELAEDPVIRDRFQREARAAAKVRGPNITQIHDYGVYDGAPYMAMELLEGEDLDAMVMRGETPRVQDLANIITQLCRGLSLAHDAGIVHRDLKPSNVFLAKSGSETIVKVLDFGIAKLTAPDMSLSKRTESGVLVGSPRYMSPEQATGEPLDRRSDLWSLGVLIYEVLTQISPFEADNLGRVITMICVEDVAPPSRHRPELGPHVDAFFVRAFQRDPKDRFGSATEMALAFETVARGEPLPPPVGVDPWSTTVDSDDPMPIPHEKPVIVGSVLGRLEETLELVPDEPVPAEPVPDQPVPTPRMLDAKTTPVMAQSTGGPASEPVPLTSAPSDAPGPTVAATTAAAVTPPSALTPPVDPSPPGAETSPDFAMDTNPEIPKSPSRLWLVALLPILGIAAWLLARPADRGPTATPSASSPAVVESSPPPSSSASEAPPSTPEPTSSARSESPSASATSQPPPPPKPVPPTKVKSTTGATPPINPKSGLPTE
jgi:eukaryotic-like serine/threonine-protein kinase